MKNHFPNSFAEIRLQALSENLEALKRKHPGKKVLAVVKCNAYSHGAVRCSKHVEEHVDWFAVASVDEGIELRMAGIRKPVLVFGVPEARTAAAYLTHNLTATVSHKAHFSILMDGTRYHLNIDTGMGRLGFAPEEAAGVRELAMANSRLVCSGIYSHYATADDPGSEFVITQYRQFKRILKFFDEIPLVHMSNTGAALNYGEHEIDHFHMIRTGLGMLGYNSGKTQYDWLNPALTWRTRIVQVRPVKKGWPVSYTSSWRSPEDGYLATLPVGYGDGVPRSLSNKLQVWIDGRMYPQSGNVTMDAIMVWLGRDKASPGTEVTLMGKETWSASDWAEHAGTNVHETLTNIQGRVERIYPD